jgi:integrase/recombinase XerD
MAALAPIIQEYFTAHLITQRAMSPATIRAYRDTWMLFLTFVSSQVNTPAYRLDTAHINPALVIAFLDHLEQSRGNCVATRNLRLAAIKGLMAFNATKTPEQLDTTAQIMAIPVKKKPKSEVTYLTLGQAEALLNAIGSDTWIARRDLALFTLAIQTGLRLSELTSLTIASVHLGAAPHVACTGKGRKRRTTPLTSSTAAALATYLQERTTRPGQALFPNPRGLPLSSDAVQRRFACHLARAAANNPELAEKHVTVHTLRHTAAMRFLEAGIDTAVIALWLGHETTATTSIYLHADMNIKRAALDRTRHPDAPAGSYQPSDRLIAWLQSL